MSVEPVLETAVELIRDLRNEVSSLVLAREHSDEAIKDSVVIIEQDKPCTCIRALNHDLSLLVSNPCP